MLRSLIAAVLIVSIITCHQSSTFAQSGHAAPAGAIDPGGLWRDTQGNVIQAHAPGIIQVADTWYWFGEDKTSGSRFQNIRCYTSTDLTHWTFRKNALTPQPSGDLGPNRIVERPKVIYNRSTKTYVMYIHIDDPDYREGKVGVATSQQPEGPYAYLGSFSPLGHQSRDLTLYQDDDGVGYLIFEDSQRGICIACLSSDYLTVVKEVALIPDAYQAPALVKVAGSFYLLGSHITGRTANGNEYSTAPSIAGPWSPFDEVAPSSKNTFASQAAFILPVVGTKTTSYLYLGDRWQGSDLSDSRYVWLPLNVGGGTMLLSTLQPWSIDVATGIITLIASPASSDQAISPTAAPPAKPAVGGNGFGKPGKVTIDGTVAVDTPASATYINAHLVTENGSTLDSLKLKAFINPTDNTLQKVVATSKVKATFTQAITNRKYTMYCDEAIYDPKLDQVHLTGSVRILIETSYTQGPLVQTGVTALVQLGNGPDYPVITTNDVRTTFTVSK